MRRVPVVGLAPSALTAIKRTLTPPPPQSMALGAFARTWLEIHSIGRGLKPRSIDSQVSALEVHILPALGELPLHQVTAAVVAEFRAQLLLDGRRGPKTANNILSVLSRMLKCAVEWGHLQDAPTVRQVKTAEPEIRWYCDAELDRLVRAARALDRRQLAVVLLAADAGLRAGEILALRCEDVDGGDLRVHRSISKGYETAPKGGRGRTVPMTRRLRAVLAGLPAGLPAGHVIVDRRGQRADEWDLRDIVNKAQLKAGLEPLGVHALRHTFCSRLAALGVSIYVIKELAGHRDISTTMRYVHLAPGAAGSKAIRSLGV